MQTSHHRGIDWPTRLHYKDAAKKDITRALRGLYRRYKDVSDVTQTLQGPYCKILIRFDEIFITSVNNGNFDAISTCN